jgi:hypothetical protein
MGLTSSVIKVNYEDMQMVVQKPEIYLLLNTLPKHEQHCLLFNTLHADDEEIVINKFLKQNKNIKIVLYGRNSNDESVAKKCQQLTNLGFSNLHVYSGGLFEWLLLQDIYGQELFPTTASEFDVLKFKSPAMLNARLLQY